jgi:hypothetical protein
MYYRDHDPAHFHVRYAGQRAIVAIEKIGILQGLRRRLRRIPPLESNLLKDIVATQPLDGYRLHIRFEDGTEGVVDLSKHLSFRGVFEPLKDLSYFREVRVDPSLGTVVWPNGADLDPDVLFSEVTGTPIVLTGDSLGTVSIRA